MDAPAPRDYLRHLTQFQDLVATLEIMDWTEMGRMETALREVSGPVGWAQDMGLEILNVVQKRRPGNGLGQYGHVLAIAESFDFFSPIAK